MQDMVIAKRVESPVALEAPRQAAERSAAFDDHDVPPTRSSERVSRRGARQATPKNDHRRVQHELASPALPATVS
jgi:hypothetical protein